MVTTGGTGPAPRDVTPEATEAVCERMMPGYGEQMRAISLRCALSACVQGCSPACSTHARGWQGCRYVPTAVLSRQTAGLRGKCLIINLPGKPKAIRETIDEVQASSENADSQSSLLKPDLFVCRSSLPSPTA